MIRAIRYIFAAFALAFAITAFAEVEEDEGVLVLTDQNFDDVLKQHNLILVEFYAPWCGHCKKLAPEYTKAAQALKSSDPAVPLAKVDATAEKELAQRFEIRGFPTLKFFRNGAPSDYNGGRTESDIVAWILKKAGPPAHTLNTDEDLETFKAEHEVHVVGLINDASSAAGKAFLDAAASDDNLAYGITNHAALRASLDIGNGDAVVLCKPFDEERNILPLTEATTTEEITKFVTAHSRPLVQYFTKESAQQIFSSSIQVHVLFFTNNEAEYHNERVNTFTEAAKSLRGRALVVNIPHSENRILDFFGVTEDSLPTAYIADMRAGSSMKKFKIDNSDSAENIVDAAEKFFAGELKPTLKSEEPTDDDESGKVKVAKGKTFHDMVINNDKNVFVEFYAPWCGHCKKLAPIWEEVGEKFADASNVVIAKIDATANEVDVDGVEVQGFPTLYFFKGNDKSHPMRYEGERELDALVKYVEEHAGASSSSSSAVDEL